VGSCPCAARKAASLGYTLLQQPAQRRAHGGGDIVIGRMAPAIYSQLAGDALEQHAVFVGIERLIAELRPQPPPAPA